MRTDLFGQVASDAMLSPCGTYRYWLTRRWDTSKERVTFICLNPSTADASVDDPTIRRLMGFARGWDKGGIAVLNLFALRSTDPAALAKHPDPVGPENNSELLSWTATGEVVAAWGSHSFARSRAAAVLKMLAEYDTALQCFGVTADGSPKHPLYLPATATLRPFTPAPLPSPALPRGGEE